MPHMTSMHWARWGDPAEQAPLAGTVRDLVEAAFGPTTARSPVPLDEVRLPEAALDRHLLDELGGIVGADHLQTDHEARIRHTRGRSTPDLLRMRGGDGGDAPDVVVRPGDHEQVAAVVGWCSEHGVALVPFGGGTSVVGGLTARDTGLVGVVALDLRRLDRLVSVDEVSGTAVLEAGMLGPQAEAALAGHGLTLGHYPQSFEYASIGGFAATRSSGQASSGYGRFDSMVVGLTAATPIGTLSLGSAPATAAGPDLRQLVLGSEGAFGVITSVTVRVRPAPQVTVYEGWRLESFDAGLAAVRELAQAGAAPTVLRLSDENETAVDLSAPDQVAVAVSTSSTTEGGVLLLTGFEGDRETVDASRALVGARLRDAGGSPLGEDPGRAWLHGRFRAPYLRDSLLDLGVLVETLETATFWSRVPDLYAKVSAALTEALAGDSPLVLCHVSHVYPTGASLYFTVAARQADDGLEQWSRAKRAASEAIVASGATITHHHAVGRDHRPWLAAEIGPVGVEMLRAVKERLDPNGVLNPGALIP